MNTIRYCMFYGPGNSRQVIGARRIDHYVERTSSSTSLATLDSLYADGFAGGSFMYVMCIEQQLTGSFWHTTYAENSTELNELLGDKSCWLWKDASRTQRLTKTISGQTFGYLDPRSAHVRQVAARKLAAILARSSHLDGIFYDNVLASYDKMFAKDLPSGSVFYDGQGRPYTKGVSADNDYFVQGVRDFLAYLKANVTAPNGRTYIHGGNLIYQRSSTDWNTWPLDFVMDEAIVGWTQYGENLSAERIDATIQRGYQFASSGRGIMAVHQSSSATNTDSARYGQCVALMLYPTGPNAITWNGKTIARVTMRHADSRTYGEFWRMPDDALDLGNPIEAPRKVGTGTWERRFERGLVTVDANTRRGTITVLAAPPAEEPPSAEEPPTEDVPSVADLVAAIEALQQQLVAVAARVRTLETAEYRVVRL